jgi:glucokinase
VAEAIGLDIGGTKIAGMRVRDDGAIMDRRSRPTPASGQERIFAAVLDVAHGLLNEGVSAIGVGAAGIVSGLATVRYSPNLPYRDLDVGGRLRAITGLPVVVDNDANVAAWGEHRAGAGRGVDDMLLVTVGTGIGGGIVSGGRLFRGANGFAAEIGHIIVEPGGPTCGCGVRGCWEQMASGAAIERQGIRAARDDAGSLLRSLAGGDPDRVTGPIVTEAARRGDQLAANVLADVGQRLGEGIGGLVNVLDPRVVVVGGGAVAAGDALLGPAREALRGTVEAGAYRPDVPLVAAELGNDAGCVGAALLALDEAAG